MVKRTLFVLAAACSAAVLWGVGARESIRLSPAAMSFPAVRPAPFASLVRRGASVMAVYADLDTTSLRVSEVPVAGALPAVAPKPSFVDKVDIASPLGATFGLHAAAAVDGRLHLLYLDREKEDRQLLKSVTENTGGWRLELVEPVGPPVAVLAGVDGAPLYAWAPGPLLARRASVDRQLWPALKPRGQGSVIQPASGGDASGFAVWDDATGSLVVTRADADGLQTTVVPGAGPVHALAQAPDGGLAVVSWDAASRRILLLERAASGGSFVRTTVTICDGTNGLFLAWTPEGWMFVYDEVRPAPFGRVSWELCMLTPESRTVGHPRYRRSVLSSDSRPLAGFRTLVADGSLFVLEMREELRLLKTPLGGVD